MNLPNLELLDLNFCTDVSLLAAFTPRKAPDHAGKPLEHFRPTKLGSSESLFAPGLRRVEAGVLEKDSRPEESLCSINGSAAKTRARSGRASSKYMDRA